MPIRFNASVASASIAAISLSLAACRRSTVDMRPDAGHLEVIQQSAMLDTLAREPMLVQHPNGSIFVSAYNRKRPRVWRSADLGASWREVNVGMPGDGAVGNSDVDLAVAPDGTLYLVAMTFNGAAGEGVQLAVGVSLDAGTTWKWTTVTRTRYVDRPWIEVTPNGTAHLIWNDGAGVVHISSKDRGASWSSPQRVHDRGGSSHLAVGPHGEVAIHIIPGARSGAVCDEGTDIIALSADDGATWTKFPAAGTARPTGCLNRPNETSRWVDPIAFDRNGALYSVWTDSLGVWLSRHRASSSGWITWPIVKRAAKSPEPFFPYMTIGRDGQIAASWVLLTPDTLHWQAARIAMPDENGAPRITVSEPFALESWRNGGPDAGGEYLATAVLNDGSIAVVTPIQNATRNRFGFGWRRFASLSSRAGGELDESDGGRI